MNNDPQQYEIRTLQDIWNIPSPETMATCLKEMSDQMIQARAAESLLLGSLPQEAGIKRAFTWPEVAIFTDDGKGEVSTTVSTPDGKTQIKVTTHP